MSRPDSPPSALEERGERLGIRFSRGRTLTSNSHLALEGGEYAAASGVGWEYHHAMFKAYFEDLLDIGKVDTIVEVAKSVGLEPERMREALEEGVFREVVEEGLAWSRSIGVSAVPTFVFDERYGMVGAQEPDAFRAMLAKVGAKPKAT